ncbi:transglutaminaseTgpA domain-containing protein [Actinosynnema sp. NPDC050801]|uniref:transglutaminase family protein n=1 Tax=unclassified Actinosynnema TaxID=2637065 RepID=UPI0033DEBA38
MRSVRVVSAAALGALAAWSFRPAFDSGAGLAVTWAVVVPAVVVVVWELLTASLLKRTAGGVGTALALLWVVVAAAAVTRPGSAALEGPFRLLTSALPTDAAPPQLAAVSVLSGLTALAAVQVVTRNALLPLVPALLSLGLGLSLSASVGPLPAWYVPVFVVVAVVPVLFHGGSASRVRLVMGVVAVVPAVAAALLLGPADPAVSRPPASAQALVDAPVRPKPHTNPMAQYLALRDQKLVLRIDGTASARVERLGMVTLTEFDGRGWSPGSTYRRAAHQLPAPPQGTAPRRQVSVDLRVLTPDSIGWLPKPGWPRRVSVTDLGFAGDTGDLVVPADGDTPAGYRIESEEPLVPPELLSTDQPAPRADRPDFVLPPDVLAFVDTATAGRHTELDRFLGLYHNLGAEPFHHDSSEEAPSGNGVYQISALLKNHRGTSEQYASAFAVLCRQLGWDARVVLGFKPRWDGDTLVVEGRDVHAWTEVRFDRLGWLPIDPSPTREAPRAGGDPAGQPDRSDTGTVQLPPAHDPAPPSESDATAFPVAAPPPPSESVAMPIVVGAMLLLLLLVPLLNIVRLRKRGRGSTRRRVLQAWGEAVVALRAAGAAVNEHQTTGQVVEAAPVGCVPVLHPFADLVDRAAYGPDEVTEEMALTAAGLRDQLRERLRAASPWGRRTARLFDPRPLVARRRPAEYGQRSP